MQFVFFKFYTHASLQNCCSIKNKPDLGLTRSSSWLCYLLAVWPWLDYLMCLSVQFPSPALFTLWGLWGFSQLLYTRNSGIRRIYKEFCVSLPFQMRFLPALLILDRWTFIRKHCRNVGPEWIWASNSFWARQTWASHTHTQHKSWESSLFSVSLTTMAQETNSQRALRKCFQEVRGEVSKHVILAKGVHAAKHTSQ